MPHKQKMFKCGDATITVWDTGNVSILVTKPLNFRELDSCLAQNSVLTLPNLESFTESMNYHLSGSQPTSFLYATTPHHNACLTYLSNYGLYSMTPDEMRVDAQFAITATAENILADLATMGFSFGIDHSAIEASIGKAAAGWVTIAQGKNAIPPQPRKYKFDFLAERPLPVSMKHKEKVSFIDFSISNQVLAGDQIGSYVEASGGEAGTSVTGHAVPSTNETDETVHFRNNFVIRDGGIFSEVAGMLDFNHKVVGVVPIKMINRPLNNQTIDFNGTIIVYSSVTNCKITATNDVYLHGLVTDTEVSAMGFVYLMTGIRGNKSKVHTTHDIFSPLVHDAELISLKGNIYIAYECFHSTLRAQGPVIVDNTFADGSIFSNTGIRVLIAGNSKSGDKTLLQLSIKRNEKDELLSLNEELREAEAELRAIAAEKKRYEIRNFANKKKIKEDPLYVQYLKNELTVTLKMQGIRDHIASIRNFVNDRVPQILITQAVYYGTTIKINHQELAIPHDETYASKFIEGSFGLSRLKYV